MMKKYQRLHTLKQLKEQNKTKKVDYDQQLAEHFWQTVSYQKANVLALYMAFPFEYNTAVLRQRALLDGKKVVVPKTYPKGKMEFFSYDEKSLEVSPFGLLEPKGEVLCPKSEIDLMVVPGVVFNKERYRIGYGAGYYDRYLKDFSGKTVSFVYPCQMKEFEPESHDIAVEELFYGHNEELF